jgi:hypothetical protein
MNAYTVLVANPDESRAPGRPKHGWQVNIKMDLREIGWGGTDWIHLVQDRD